MGMKTKCEFCGQRNPRRLVPGDLVKCSHNLVLFLVVETLSPLVIRVLVWGPPSREMYETVWYVGVQDYPHLCSEETLLASMHGNVLLYQPGLYDDE